jgi:hypothetical protein
MKASTAKELFIGDPTIIYDWKIEKIKLLGMAITGLKADGTFLFKTCLTQTAKMILRIRYNKCILYNNTG